MEKGEMSSYMKEFAFPMAASLLASLLVALTIIPLALSRMKERKDLYFFKLARRIFPKRPPSPRGPRFPWLRYLRIHPINLSIDAYAAALRHIMHRRLVSVVAIILLLVITFLLPFRRVGLQQMATLDMREVDVNVELDQNFDMAMAKAAGVTAITTPATITTAVRTLLWLGVIDDQGPAVLLLAIQSGHCLAGFCIGAHFHEAEASAASAAAIFNNLGTLHRAV
jgi:multidrug efflux pump subunit AcrB